MYIDEGSGDIDPVMISVLGHNRAAGGKQEGVWIVWPEIWIVGCYIYERGWGGGMDR